MCLVRSAVDTPPWLALDWAAKLKIKQVLSIPFELIVKYYILIQKISILETWIFLDKLYVVSSLSCFTYLHQDHVFLSYLSEWCNIVLVLN